MSCTPTASFSVCIITDVVANKEMGKLILSPDYPTQKINDIATGKAAFCAEWQDIITNDVHGSCVIAILTMTSLTQYHHDCVKCPRSFTSLSTGDEQFDREGNDSVSNLIRFGTANQLTFFVN